MRTALVFVGGPHRPATGHPSLERLVEVPADLVVAVDSGLHLAESLCRGVDLVVGDMDSVAPDALERARAGGAATEAHPADKDATDLELSLDALVVRGITEAIVVAPDGGRMDHLLGGVLTLCSPRFASIRLEAWLGGAFVAPVRDRLEVRGLVGRQLSILPVHGAAVVRTGGLRWPLADERLEPGTSRGLSNEVAAELATVTVHDGCVAVVVPEEER